MPRLASRIAPALALLAAGACADPAASTAPVAPAPTAHVVAAEPYTIRLGYFSRPTIIRIGVDKGFFADEGLAFDEWQTPSSPAIFASLRDGDREIILTQADNVFNYRYNPHNPIGQTFDPVVFMGTDHGGGSYLAARPEYPTVESLRGKTLTVDSPNSGLAFVAYAILRAHGLEKDRDYHVLTTGGTPRRLQDLLNYDALPADQRGEMTILGGTTALRAQDLGMNLVGNLTEVVPAFLGGSGVARSSWLREHPDVAVRFIRAYQRAVAHYLDPAHRDEIIDLLTAESNGNRSLGERAYALNTDPHWGTIADASIDREGLYYTARLRAQVDGGFETPMNLRWLTSPASGMFEEWYWQRAMLSQGWR